MKKEYQNSGKNVQYSTAQLAKKLDCHPDSIHGILSRYKDKGGIPGAKRIGHMWTFTDESAEFIKALKPGRKLGSKNKPKGIVEG